MLPIPCREWYDSIAKARAMSRKSACHQELPVYCNSDINWIKHECMMQMNQTCRPPASSWCEVKLSTAAAFQYNHATSAMQPVSRMIHPPHNLMKVHSAVQSRKRAGGSLSLNGWFCDIQDRLPGERGRIQEWRITAYFTLLDTGWIQNVTFQFKFFWIQVPTPVPTTDTPW